MIYYACIREWRVSFENRACGKGRGVGIGDRGLLHTGSSGGHTGLFAGFEFS
jgi:hypothetical protein